MGGDTLENPDSDVEGQEEGVGASSSREAKGEGKEGEGPKSLEDNTRHLIWVGALRERAFTAFKARSCETDWDAKELLEERTNGYWNMAKNWKGEEELF